jgi:hypothetical protein
MIQSLIPALRDIIHSDPNMVIVTIGGGYEICAPADRVDLYRLAAEPETNDGLDGRPIFGGVATASMARAAAERLAVIFDSRDTRTPASSDMSAVPRPAEAVRSRRRMSYASTLR